MSLTHCGLLSTHVYTSLQVFLGSCIYGTLQRFAPISPKQHLEAVSVEATAKADGAKNLEMLVAVPSIVWFSALKYYLVGGLEHVFIFPYIGKNNPN